MIWTRSWALFGIFLLNCIHIGGARFLYHRYFDHRNKFFIVIPAMATDMLTIIAFITFNFIFFHFTVTGPTTYFSVRSFFLHGVFR